MANKNRSTLRASRHVRLRKKVAGTQARPRLAVFRSLKHISAQIIDDTQGVTLVAASSHEKDFDGKGGNVDAAKKIGTVLAERAKAAGVSAVVFDRGGFKYHGRVAALADGAREAGLEL